PAPSKPAEAQAPVAAPPPTPSKPVEAKAPAVAPPAAPPPPSSVEPADAAGPLSPLVRRMAREQNIDLSLIRGTGAGGRITKQDVEAYVAQKAGDATAATPPTA